MSSRGTGSEELVRIPFDELVGEFERILLKYGFRSEKAKTCAAIFAENTLVGVNTHGVNRFPRFVGYVKDGHVRPDAEPRLKLKVGALEQWDGCLGPGPLNALFCTRRGMEIARESGIGCVALSNTNHWMRGGYFGWEAARAGFVFIGWTNTIANMPAWGAVDCRLGNNPIVLGVPFADDAIVLDMAMSQFSYGSVELHQLRKKDLPLPGGYDSRGTLTTDPDAILKSGRMLPAGYWKGSGLAVMLDLISVILTGGESTLQISKRAIESHVSQVFVLVDPSKLGSDGAIAASIRDVIDDLHRSIPAPGVDDVLAPGERVQKTRIKNLADGIPIDKAVWLEVQRL
jgi:3-dehydro-L-gulonate 2-dehydrogenase